MTSPVPFLPNQEGLILHYPTTVTSCNFRLVPVSCPDVPFHNITSAFLRYPISQTTFLDHKNPRSASAATMVGLRSIERAAAWNIRIVRPSPSNELITGVFQSIQSPFLSWRDLFDDLLLCFDLESAVTSPLGQLTLWNRNKDETFANNKTFVCFSTDESDSTILSTFIRVGNSTDGSDTSDELASKLTLTLVLHKISKCTCTKSCLDDHLSSGMPHLH